MTTLSPTAPGGPAYELAQVNIARLRHPLESAELKDFVDALDPVNAVADGSDGFRWRLQSDSGNATDVPVLGDRWLIMNLTVWRDMDALTAFMYTGRHRELLARRFEWFERVEEAMTTLWWVEAGARPTPRDAELRLLHLREHGPTAHAFTLRKTYGPPGDEAPETAAGRPAGARTDGVAPPAGASSSAP
ncbi:hypothetical protein GCM10011583_04090 [Streptomyces camponoticapitis]|uniref:DUF3291 domain-containing protein n=1 Tax=Streptomyces camponoticapitis TaxID=1616125 RepID=A0ABQ2DYC5_9ACTN|nr:DUF3291 domain-containing protein [Streptomyces camponoticapitis]GGJ75817.1 hypothetical protein GCM10011583_04090 [Streptomyces camponoticapitis]